MSENLFTEASLADSVLFQSFNTNSEMTLLIANAIKKSVKLDRGYIDEQILQIQRTRISPLADRVLDAFDQGNIVLLHSTVKKIPEALPFFTTKIQGKVVTFVFTNNYGTLSKANEEGQRHLIIPMKDLYVLMEGAFIAYSHATLPQKLQRSLGLMKSNLTMYTLLMMRILNKEYALSMDQSAYDKVSFCFARFFAERIWMSTNADVNITYAKSVVARGTNGVELSQLSDEYDLANILNLEDLINFIRGISPRLSTLTIRYFMQCVITLYRPAATFGTEVLPYFMFTITSSMIGSFIVNQAIISDVIKTVKGMNNYYAELVKALVN